MFNGDYRSNAFFLLGLELKKFIQLKSRQEKKSSDPRATRRADEHPEFITGLEGHQTLVEGLRAACNAYGARAALGTRELLREEDESKPHFYR